MDELGLEIVQIAFPAALALTADPLASLIDTAFIGQIGLAFSVFLEMIHISLSLMTLYVQLSLTFYIKFVSITMDCL